MPHRLCQRTSERVLLANKNLLAPSVMLRLNICHYNYFCYPLNRTIPEAFSIKYARVVSLIVFFYIQSSLSRENWELDRRRFSVYLNLRLAGIIRQDLWENCQRNKYKGDRPVSSLFEIAFHHVILRKKEFCNTILPKLKWRTARSVIVNRRRRLSWIGFENQATENIIR